MTHGLRTDRLLTEEERAVYVAIRCRLSNVLAAEGRRATVADALLIECVALQYVKALRKDRWDAGLPGGLPATTGGDFATDAPLLGAVRALGLDRRFPMSGNAGKRPAADLCQALAALDK